MAGKALPSAGLPTGLYMQEKSGNETVEGRIIYWLNFPTLRVTSSGLEYMEDYQHQEREPRELAIMTKAAALTKASQSNQTVNYAQATRGELTLCYAKPSGTHNCVITFEAADRID